jgi:3-hydroxyisobutyrate dehydrogenase-like beta-hydroxyacid dehydrogenase
MNVTEILLTLRAVGEAAALLERLGVSPEELTRAIAEAERRRADLDRQWAALLPDAKTEPKETDR